MFRKKYNITLIDSKWNIIKNNLKFDSIPNRDEFIYLIDRYFQVVNIVHKYDKNHTIFVIIEEIFNNNEKK